MHSRRAAGRVFDQPQFPEAGHGARQRLAPDAENLCELFMGEPASKFHPVTARTFDRRQRQQLGCQSNNDDARGDRLELVVGRGDALGQGRDEPHAQFGSSNDRPNSVAGGDLHDF